MRVIEVLDGVTGYWQLLSKVLSHGEKRSPRGRETLDVGPVTVVTHDTSAPLPLGCGRNVSKKIAAVEALQLIGGFSSPELTVAASRNFQQFREPDTGHFHGAYGVRIKRQLYEVVRKLHHDRDTRQAVVTLWDPWLDNQPGKRDYPCTVTLGFAIARDALDIYVTMRSQDCWLGTPYDWFQFSQAQRTVARALDVEPGRYYHTTWSTHIYVENVADAEFVIDQGPPPHDDREYQPQGFGREGSRSIVDAMGRAHAIGLTGRVTDPTGSERWYVDVVASLVG